MSANRNGATMHGAGAGVGLGVRATLAGAILAGVQMSSLYEIECTGPLPGFRDHYLDCLAEAEALDCAGEFPRAAALRARAESLRGTLWRESAKNLVVNVGLDDLLDKRFKASAFTASDFVGLKGTGAVAAGDTMASHAGWSELTLYSEASRQALTLGAVSGQSVDNSASKASFSINATGTVAGAFVNTDNTKGGTTGILYGAADFAASRSVNNGDTLNVTVTLTSQAV